MSNNHTAKISFVLSSLSVLLVAIISVFLFLQFAPGHFSGDTANSFFLFEYHWAQSDWHSPMLGVIWQGLRYSWDSPQSLLAFNISCFLLTLTVFICFEYERPAFWCKFYWPIILLTPFIFNYAGALIKDTTAAALTVLAIALMFASLHSPRFRVLSILVACGLVVTGVLVKPASLFMAIPILFFGLLSLVKPRSCKSVLTIMLITGLAFPAVFSVLSSGLKEAVGTRPSYVHNAIFLFDLNAMSSISQTDHLDGFVSKTSAQRADICYDPLSWDNLVWGNCYFIFKDVTSRRLWENDELKKRWMFTVLNNPMLYIQHRWTHFKALISTKGRHLFYLYRQDERIPWKPRASSFTDAMNRYYQVGHATDVVFKPILWLVGSCLLFVVAALQFLRRQCQLTVLVLCLTSSNIIFFATLFFFGIAYDFRYFYTVIWQFMIALGLLLGGSVNSNADIEAKP